MSKLRVLALSAALTASLALGGCVTLLPKTKPAQLYRFGETAGEGVQSPAAPGAAAQGLILSTGFTTAAEGDRILTTTGAQSAYIAQSRWVSPASVMFAEAATRAFENSGAPFRMMRRGDIGPSTLSLRIDVEAFEADYAGDGKSAPTVQVRARVTLMRPSGRGGVAFKDFTVSKPASENRMGPIVAAFDGATNDLLAQIVAWTTAQAGGVNASE